MRPTMRTSVKSKAPTVSFPTRAYWKSSVAYSVSSKHNSNLFERAPTCRIKQDPLAVVRKDRGEKILHNSSLCVSSGV
jgi:hypothetical protein